MHAPETKPARLLHVGEILAPHALKGALTIYSHTRPALGIAGYSFWWVGNSDGSAKPFRVLRCWQHGKRLLAELEHIGTTDAAAALKGQKIWVPAEAVDLAESEYLWEDLVGCEVFDDGEGALLGKVVALEEYGAQDILTVRTRDDAPIPGEWMIPFVPQIIVAVDVDDRRIVVNLPDGMDACFTPRS